MSRKSSVRRSQSSSMMAPSKASQQELAALLFTHRLALEKLLAVQENAALVRFVSGELDSTANALKEGPSSSSSKPGTSNTRGAGMLFRGHKKPSSASSASNNNSTTNQTDRSIQLNTSNDDTAAANNESSTNNSSEATEDLKSLQSVLTEELAKLDNQIRSLRATPSQVAAKNTTQSKRMLTVDKMDLLLRDRDVTGDRWMWSSNVSHSKRIL